MTWDEYNKLFHKEQLNLVAFKRLMDCDQEVLRLVNAAIKIEREECAKVCDQMPDLQDGWRANLPSDCAAAIRARGKE
jgi:hypothetical protein